MLAYERLLENRRERYRRDEEYRAKRNTYTRNYYEKRLKKKGCQWLTAEDRAMIKALYREGKTYLQIADCTPFTYGQVWRTVNHY